MIDWWVCYPAISSDKYGNCIAVWHDQRNMLNNFEDPDIYGQYVNADCQLIGDNFRVHSDSGKYIQYDPSVKIKNNRVYYAWADGRYPGHSLDIYAKVDEFILPNTAIEINKISNFIKNWQLTQNYPNPFNAETSISFDTPEKAHVKIEIFNLMGQHIQTILDEKKSPGSYNINWNGMDKSGQVVGSGIYLYKMLAGGFQAIRKMALVR